MGNKKLLICIAVLMITLGVFSVITACVLTTPNNNNVLSGENSDNIIHSPSTDSSLCSGDVSSDDSNIALSSQESSEPQVPVLVLPIGTELYSKIAVVYDTSIGEVIYSKDANTLTAPASLTKLVTAMVALDYLSPNKTITVGTEIELIGKNSSIAFLAVGQRYSVKSLIEGLLIPSGNDAAYVLAVNAARVAANDNTLSAEKAVSDFVRLMNDKVNSIGCVSTVFGGPDGFDAQGQQTTAMDILKISIEARKNATIRETVAKAKSGGWENSNLLLQKDSEHYNECVSGLKTGHTDAAGYCVAVSAEIDSTQYIMVFMQNEKRAHSFMDANTIINLIKGVEEESSEELTSAA